MTDSKEKGTGTDKGTEKKSTLSLGSKGTLSLKGGAASGAAAAPRAAQPTRGGKSVAVEVRRKRSGSTTAPMSRPTTEANVEAEDHTAGTMAALRQLTSEEREARIRALQAAEEESKRRADTSEDEDDRSIIGTTVEYRSPTAPAIVTQPETAEQARQRELEELQRIEEEEQQKKRADERRHASTTEHTRGPGNVAAQDIMRESARPGAAGRPSFSEDEQEEESYRERMKKASVKAPPSRRGEQDRNWNPGRLTVQKALSEDVMEQRGRSLAATRRARAKAHRSMTAEPQQKVLREVVLPEFITVQELANRMTERSSDVVKALMKLGVMATITQTIDADTAELIVTEFGHTIKRVTEGDVEIGIEGDTDAEGDLLPRPPVVTIMGHVDHGKTSLLDALRATDVVAGEAGGITQHIGAYQVTMPSGHKITFLDTPGHAAFTEMRARGANVTDIVVLVVAANDSIMPQTIEAINHAKAAGVPIIVAINKIDLPDANPNKVRQDLLQHEIVLEEMGGETMAVELSAKKRINLDKLEETILLQAEMLNLRANPNRRANGTVVEAKLEQGRGNVATVLVENGTLRVGDIFVAGAESGRVRALLDDRGNAVKQALPGQPVEVLGLQGAPEAGDKINVVEDDARAREIAAYRARKKREQAAASIARRTNSLEQMIAAAKEGEKTTLPVVIKADVHGSVEAIAGSLQKISEDNPDVMVRVLHSGVGGITESDIILAKASNAMIIGFNVRANTQARTLAERDGVNIRYYSIIYNIIDDAKAILSGMLAPNLREEYLGQASIRQVFNITKVGKVAGCMITNGVVKRGSKVRLLRDDVVIHEGTLKTLKRFKDEVKEVKEGMECGMAFENYDDIKDGDVIECFDIVSEARTVG